MLIRAKVTRHNHKIYVGYVTDVSKYNCITLKVFTSQ